MAFVLLQSGRYAVAEWPLCCCRVAVMLLQSGRYVVAEWPANSSKVAGSLSLKIAVS